MGVPGKCGSVTVPWECGSVSEVWQCHMEVPNVCGRARCSAMGVPWKTGSVAVFWNTMGVWHYFATVPWECGSATVQLGAMGVPQYLGSVTVPWECLRVWQCNGVLLCYSAMRVPDVGMLQHHSFMGVPWKGAVPWANCQIGGFSIFLKSFQVSFILMGNVRSATYCLPCCPAHHIAVSFFITCLKLFEQSANTDDDDVEDDP